MKIMAVDYGAARTGLAVCDRTEFLASPVGVIHEKDFNRLIKQIAIATTEYDVKMLVVGQPKNMDGSIGEKAKKCELLVEKLKELITIPIVLWDERQSTMQAHNYLNDSNVKGQKRKDIIDEVAATIILESYLQYRKNSNEN